MVIHLPLLFIVLFATPFATGVPCDSACQQVQRKALVDIYTALDGPKWRAQNGWLSEQPYCSWDGVTCCQPHDDNGTLGGCKNLGVVISLNLFANHATGSIPDSALAKLLPDMIGLDLRDNSIRGTLPAFLTLAKRLQWFLGDGNHFHGTLPHSWSKLTSLHQLTLGQNQLTGKLPASYTEIVGLRELVLENNCITGQFPVDLFTLADLEVSLTSCCASWSPYSSTAASFAVTYPRPCPYVVQLHSLSLSPSNKSLVGCSSAAAGTYVTAAGLHGWLLL